MNAGKILAASGLGAVLLGGAGFVVLAFLENAAFGCVGLLVYGVVAFFVSCPLREAFEERERGISEAWLESSRNDAREAARKRSEELTAERTRRRTLERAALTLYADGVWSCLQLPDAVQRQRWEALRDALGLESPGSEAQAREIVAQWDVAPPMTAEMILGWTNVRSTL